MGFTVYRNLNSFKGKSITNFSISISLFSQVGFYSADRLICMECQAGQMFKLKSQMFWSLSLTVKSKLFANNDKLFNFIVKTFNNNVKYKVQSV